MRDLNLKSNAMKLTLATFNIENLFTRFDFSAFTDPKAAAHLPSVVQFYANFGDGDLSRFEEFKHLVQGAAVAQDDDKRQHTALALAEADADIVCLQEVDSLSALARFQKAYLSKVGIETWSQLVLHEGNDPRGIDVAAMARKKYPVMSRSHAPMTGAALDDTESGRALLERFSLAKAEAVGHRSKRVFRRDCLELEILVRNSTRSVDRRVSLFVCHFKSMSGGRTESIGVRQMEAVAVREIITRKFEGTGENAPLWAVLGDLNDYRQILKVRQARDADGRFIENLEVLEQDGPSGIDPLVYDGFGVNLLGTLPDETRWTHYYAGERHKTQLDYIIASPALAAMMEGKPQVVRTGMPFRVPNLDTQRFPRVGWDRPKASDHCPVRVEFDIR